MKPQVILDLPRYLKGLYYRREAVLPQLGLFWSEDAEEEQMMKDMISWLSEVEF